MLTAVERVLIFRGADLLREVGPRHLLELAEVAREVELTAGEAVYQEDDIADALYMIVEGRVRLSAGGRTLSEVGAGEAFGTWALVDDTERGQRAECIQDGLALALHRDAFYDVAAADLALLKEVVRALARRLRALVSLRPEEARVEGEGVEKPEAMLPPSETPPSSVSGDTPAPTPGASLAAAAVGQTTPDVAPGAATRSPAIPSAEAERVAVKLEPPTAGS